MYKFTTNLPFSNKKITVIVDTEYETDALQEARNAYAAFFKCGYWCAAERVKPDTIIKVDRRALKGAQAIKECHCNGEIWGWIK